MRVSDRPSPTNVARDKAGLNWSKNRGTIWFDGPDGAKARMAAALDGVIMIAADDKKAACGSDRTIFVVHSHDAESKEQLELILHRLELDLYVLQNTDGDGLTIIERLEHMIGKNAASSFGIVLLTPDDIGYAGAEGDAQAKPRARQNVIMEMGMLLASLTGERVAIIVKGFVEHPSDVGRIIYFTYKDHVKEVIPKLVDRFEGAGIRLDPKAIAGASA